MALLSAIESMIEDFCSMEDEASEDTGKLAKLMHNGGLWSEPAVYKGMDKALTVGHVDLLLPWDTLDSDWDLCSLIVSSRPSSLPPSPSSSSSPPSTPFGRYASLNHRRWQRLPSSSFYQSSQMPALALCRLTRPWGDRAPP